MGSGTWSHASFAKYSSSQGKTVHDDGTIANQNYTAQSLDPKLNPHGVIRECCNSKEHPNTVPVILALDVTGSMGAACQKTAEALSVIMTNLYNSFQDVEFLVMGIGDLESDDAPIQASQYESDVRIAEQLDKIYMEHGGGGNGYESYTAAWFFGLHHTKLDAYDLQGRKGIIITMGDEPLNPFLPKARLSEVLGDALEVDIQTEPLYKAACEKFDIFHIAIDDSSSSYSYYKHKIEETFAPILGDRLKVATVDTLPHVIEQCIAESIAGQGRSTSATSATSSNTSNGSSSDGISW